MIPATTTLLTGNALDVLKTLPTGSIHCSVTSSPYYGLRNYGTPPQIWGGDPTCQHDWNEVHPPGYRGSDTNPGPLQHEGNKNRDKLVSNVCSKCGAQRCELGLEKTPGDFIKHLVQIYHELYRVLRDDGIFWCNIGDSYASAAGKGGSGTPTGRNGRGEDYQRPQGFGECKPKDLMEIPSMLASAMRSDGWYLRSRLPWVKRSALPSSVIDRPGSSLEYFFLFAKSGNPSFWVHPTRPAVRIKPEPDYIYKHVQTGVETANPPADWNIPVEEDGQTSRLRWKRRNLWAGRDYFYDHVAVMQKSSESYNKDKRPRGVLRQKVNENTKYDREDPQYAKQEVVGGLLVNVPQKQDLCGNPTLIGFNGRYEDPGTGLRFMRDSDFFFRTWQGLLQNEDGGPVALVVNPASFKGSHFATFPPKMLEPMILAGTSEGGVCPKCGAPYVRVTIRKSITSHDGITKTQYEEGSSANRISLLQQAARERGSEYCNMVETSGWLPSCFCNAGDPVPATVLDPFSGAGTTGLVCKAHNRNYIGIDLNPAYNEMASKRISEGK